MKKDINDWITRLITALLVLSMFSVGITMFAYNIAYERLHMDNPVISFFLRAMDVDSQTAANNDIKFDSNTKTIVIDWEKLYPFQENAAVSASTVVEASFAATPAYKKFSEAYSAALLKLHQVFDDYASINLPLYQEISDTSKKIKNLVFHNNINHYYPTISLLSVEDIQSVTDNITNLHQFLNSQKIPLLYVNAPTKATPSTKNINDFSNANANALLPQLSQNGISTFDFRTAIASEKLNHADLYYMGEYHWKTSTALWAAGTLADILNEKYGFHFDKKYFEKESYSIENCQNIFLSNKSLKIIEDYEAILPLYPTNFKVDIPSKDYHMSGSYADVLFRNDLLKKLKKADKQELKSLPSAYQCIRLNNEAVTHIENLNPTNNENKKILYIGDSYGWYLVPYLAADIQYLDFLHLCTFTGSLETYIKQTQPDMVIILNYAGRLKAPTAEELEKHTAFFDFR